MTVAHDAMAATIVTELIELGEDFGHFQLEGALQELPGAFADELIERRDSGRAMSVCVPSDMGRTPSPWSCEFNHPQGRRLTFLTRLVPNFFAYLPWVECG